MNFLSDIKLPHIQRKNKQVHDLATRSHVRKIVVVGGVAGGMSFAARARRLSESTSITVFEQGSYVGYANCGIPYALGGIISSSEALILQTPESIKSRYNIVVRPNCQVTRIDRKKKTIEYTNREGETGTMEYDRLVLAQGAEPLTPSIPGIHDRQVFHLQTIPHMEAIKRHITVHSSRSAIIIGGGFIGLEAAESLSALGLKVSIVEYLPHVFPPIDPDIAEALHFELMKHNIDLYLDARVETIDHSKTPKLSSCVTLRSGEKIQGEIIICVAGMRPRTALAEQAGLHVNQFGIITDTHMRTTDHHIYAVGDMACTINRVTGREENLALAGPANRQGRLVADHMFGRPVIYRGNVNTVVCKVFDIHVGIVGYSVSNLRAQDLDTEYITVHPPDHARYYPGSSEMTLKLAFSRHNGKILGAQVVGKSGVDKRLDVVATCMQASMTVFDLEDLELGYAPPFGSAKDPVNMAGFVASNVLRGDVEIVHPETLTLDSLRYYQILDVRSELEYARGHVKNAILCPLDELRDRLPGLDNSMKVLVYCQVGYRGYLAYRILKQAGFSAANLDGGFKKIAQFGYQTLIA
ncbi:hypothetical protein E8E12_002604 [Didymella heteroderae]|uniref:Rhodanese domain-containing protein n=1 Tax=Didymella heteroderae TaxID=1769908 RepID=A0A9P5BXW3_9PLEO|nr:hypothetical protein E8E12_002604 [Didymella heteroderae]